MDVLKVPSLQAEESSSYTDRTNPHSWKKLFMSNKFLPVDNNRGGFRRFDDLLHEFLKILDFKDKVLLWRTIVPDRLNKLFLCWALTHGHCADSGHGCKYSEEAHARNVEVNYEQ